MKKINKKRFLISLIITVMFLAANVFGFELSELLGKGNNYTVVYAAGARSKASSSGFKSGSFKSSSSSSKKSSAGTKSGSFSNSSPKSSSSVGSSKTSSNSSTSKSTGTNKNTNNSSTNTTNNSNTTNNYYSPRSSIIPIFIPWFSHGGGFGTSFFGGVTHSVGSFFGSIFQLIIIIIIVMILFNLFKKLRK